MDKTNMAIFNVALSIILIGVGLSSSSLRADKQQNKTESDGLKHMFGLDGIRENQNALAEKMSKIEAKLEQIENGMRDNKNAMAEKMSEIVTKLEKQIENVINELQENQNLLTTKLENVVLEMRVNQKALAEKMSKIEAKLEKQIENGKHNNKNGLTANLENGMRAKQKAPLMENMAIAALFHFPLPIYRWNASDCHPKIVINESTNSIQRNRTGERFLGIRSCRAGPIKMPSASPISIIYTEYRILAENGPLFIGLSTKEMSLDFMVGYGPVSYGYANYCRIEGQNANGNDIIISENVPSFHSGDVVGCGLNLATRQVFFTKNGQHLNITNLYVDENTADLYPTVSLYNHGDAVEANFGPNFHYDLSKKF